MLTKNPGLVYYGPRGDMADQLYKMKDTLQQHGSNIVSFGRTDLKLLSFILPTSSPFLQVFNHAILKVREAGIDSYFEGKEVKTVSQDDQSGSLVLSYNHLILLFVFYCSFIIIAVFILFCEFSIPVRRVTSK